MYPEFSLWGDFLSGIKQLVKFRRWSRKWFSLTQQTVNLFGHVLSGMTSSRKVYSTAVTSSRYFNPDHETQCYHNTELKHGVLTCLWLLKCTMPTFIMELGLTRKTFCEVWHLMICEIFLSSNILWGLLLQFNYLSFGCMTTHSWRDRNITAHWAQALQ